MCVIKICPFLCSAFFYINNYYKGKLHPPVFWNKTAWYKTACSHLKKKKKLGKFFDDWEKKCLRMKQLECFTIQICLSCAFLLTAATAC